MKQIVRIAGATLVLSLLAACGGGGGGGASAPGPVVITEASAKAVAANALDNVLNISAIQGVTGLFTGVQVDADAEVKPFPPLTVVIDALVRLVPATPALAAGVVINETVPCDLGGTLTIAGNVSGGEGLVAGDTLSFGGSDCRLALGDGSVGTLNGTMNLSVASGNMTQLPFQVVLATTFRNFSVSADGITVLSNGDMRLDWAAASATEQTLVASGNELMQRLSVGQTSRTATWRGYTQTVVASATTISSSLNAQVFSDSSAIGAGGASYQLVTSSPFVRPVSSGAISAGSLLVSGRDAAQLRVTVTDGNTFLLEVDADGNGTFETSRTASLGELEAAL